MKRYIIYQEQPNEVEGDYECCFLTPKDVLYLRVPGFESHHYVQMLFAGMRCYAAKKGDEIIAFNWINMKNIHYFGTHEELKRNEAFLFFMWVKEEYRGKGVASYLRYKTLLMLEKTGRDLFYSITDMDNKPALRFKERIWAKKLWQVVYLKIFDKAFKINRYK